MTYMQNVKQRDETRDVLPTLPRARHLDLFSGIGGFALGLESTGYYQTKAFCEIEPFPRRVLEKNWPDVPCYEDVRDVGPERLVTDGIGRIDIVTGGFPCQDLSVAGKRAGLSGERSGLWSELFRIIAEVQPRWAIVENVPGLRTLGADRVLADLAGAGYAAWPMVVGAVHAGAPHRRQRVWIVAHSTTERCGEARARQPEPSSQDDDAAHAKHHVLRPQQRRGESGRTGAAKPGDDGERWDAADSESQQARIPGQPRQREHVRIHSGWDWTTAPEPVLRGVDDGLPCGMDRRERLKALGNAVVPQIVAAIGRAIIHADRFRPASTAGDLDTHTGS